MLGVAFILSIFARHSSEGWNPALAVVVQKTGFQLSLE